MIFACGTFFAQSSISNARTATLAISGNCGMCKNKIETAANQANVSNLVWDATSKTAKLTYDSKKTTPSQIMRRVAAVGYDNEMFLAKDEVYKNLHGCCLYDRTFKNKTEAKAAGACCAGETASSSSAKSCDGDGKQVAEGHAHKSQGSCCSGS